MSAFAASTKANEMARSEGNTIGVGLDFAGAGCVVKKGDIMIIAVSDASNTVGGLAYPGCPVTNTTWTVQAPAAGDQFAGVAEYSVTSTSAYTIAGGFITGNHVDVWTKGEFEFDCSSFSLTSVGCKAWSSCTDAHTVVATEAVTHAAPVGIITWVNAAGTKCRVKIDGFAMGGSGIAA